MEHIPRKPQRSIDGFIPTQRARHVGFAPPASSGKPIQGVRMRRPGFHGQVPPTEQRRTISDFSGRPSATTHIGDTPSVKMELPRVQAGPQLGRRRRHTEAKPKGKFARLRSIRWKRVVKRTAAALGIFLVLCGGWLGWKVLHNSSKVFGGSVFGLLQSTKLDGEDQGRVNILLTGVSTDDVGHNGANLTDSIMIISLDTKNNKATLLSIPRDLWVNIPGHGYAKINAANSYGDDDGFSEAGYPRGGVGLLEEVIYQNFNLKMNYYAKINYSAIRDGVNAVGGIDFTVQSENPRGLYDPSIDWTTHGPLVKLSNGVHHLNGEQALDLARARGDAYGSYGFPRSDFDRTENQRKMLIALKKKVASTSTLSNPIKIGQLFDALGKNVKTNFKTSEIRRLYELTKKISDNGMQSASLNDANGVNLLMNYNAGGQSALAPAAGVDDFSQIQLYIKKLFSNDPVVREGAQVVVLNGGNINGLASKEKKVLTDKNISVVSISDAAATAHTTIVDQSNGKMPNTKNALTKLFGNNVTTTNTYGYPTADFIVVLGTDAKDPTASTSATQ